MAPIKFEDQLKDKLENRTLQPSPDAWNTLAERLDRDEKKRNNTRFWWLGIAASIIGVILVSTQFYKSNTDNKELPVVVNNQTLPINSSEVSNSPVEDNEVILNAESEETNDIIVSAESSEVAEATKTEVNKEEQPTKSKQKKVNIQSAQETIASHEPSKSEVNDIIPVKTISEQDLKIMEVVNVIKTLQSSQASVSDREIDSLLKQAQREILKQRIIDESSKTVSADALLQDVEVELEQSFRAKVFEALKSSYKSVKTAVAERRN